MSHDLSTEHIEFHADEVYAKGWSLDINKLQELVADDIKIS